MCLSHGHVCEIGHLGLRRACARQVLCAHSAQILAAQFRPPEPKDEEERPVPGKAPNKVALEGEEEAPKPRHVDGLGEEAYWVGNGITGALYVLQGDVFVRISVGGVHDESARIEKAKALARDVMRRL